MSVRLAAAMLPALFVATLVVAQESAVQNRQDRREIRRENRRETLGNAGRATAGAQGQSQGMDSLHVQLLAPGNMEEVALGRLAERQSQNPMVKEFAQQMVQDHSQFLEQLRRFGNVSAGPAAPGQSGAGEAGANPRSRTNRATNETSATPRQGAAELGQGAAAQGVDVQAGGVEVRTPASRTADASANAGEAGTTDSQILPIMHEVHQRCLASIERYLQQKQGAQFDDAYVGIQIVQHLQMLDKLAVATEHASPELQQVLQQGTKTTQNHFQHAERLMQQIARGGNAAGGQGQGATEGANQSPGNNQ